jgi:hypothetical protein
MPTFIVTVTHNPFEDYPNEECDSTVEVSRYCVDLDEVKNAALAAFPIQDGLQGPRIKRLLPGDADAAEWLAGTQ